MTGPGLSFQRRVTRREVLKTMGSGAVMLGAADLLAACGEIKGSSTATSGTITIGYVSPQTGALAGFATGDNWVISGIRQTDTYKNGFKLGSKTYTVNIVVKDTQSNPDRASQVARELIQSNKADLILTTHTGIKWRRDLGGDRCFVNVGVLGRPENDGRPNVWYALLESDEGARVRSKLKLALGRDVSGNPVVADLAA